MESPMKAIEVAGTVDEQGQLHLDEAVSALGPGRVRVILLLPDNSEIEEWEWLRAATRNPAFDFLKDPQEDVYTLDDGKATSTSSSTSSA